MKGRHIPYRGDELDFIRALSSLPRAVIHAEFVHAFSRTDISEQNIRSLCKRLGWFAREKRPWTPEEIAVLRRHYADTPTANIAAWLQRPSKSTYYKAHQLGLKKSAAYLASEASGRIKRGERRGAATQFKPGVAPMNKGVKRGKGWAPGRMREGQFATGGKPRNWVPVGTTRIVGGYEYTKVADRRKVRAKENWKPTHVLRWEAINGRVPEGHALKSLDGNRRNTDPANWVPVARAILPTLNGGRGRRMAYDQAPAELKPTLMAVAQLKHAIGKHRRREAQAA